MTITDRRLKALVKKDRELASEADSATLKLMQHRAEAVAEVGSNRAYARALGIRESIVRKYVGGWELWQSPARGAARTPTDVLELAALAEVKRAATEAVADATGLSVTTVRKARAQEVERVERVVREDGPEKARRYAQQQERTRANEERYRKEKLAKKPRAYITIEKEVDKARRALGQAVTYAAGSDLDEEYVEVLRESLRSVQAVLDMLNAAIVGQIAVDWDAELSRLTEGGAA
jgi:hypothetical protein